MAISTTTRAAFAAIALLASAVPASAEWKFCAPDGGHCKCFGEMRYGHPGLEEHLADDGKWFDSHPEVRRWNVRSVQGDAVACNAADFGDDPSADQKPRFAGVTSRGCRVEALRQGWRGVRLPPPRVSRATRTPPVSRSRHGLQRRVLRSAGGLRAFHVPQRLPRRELRVPGHPERVRDEVGLVRERGWKVPVLDARAIRTHRPKDATRGTLTSART